MTILNNLFKLTDLGTGRSENQIKLVTIFWISMAQTSDNKKITYTTIMLFSKLINGLQLMWSA